MHEIKQKFTLTVKSDPKGRTYTELPEDFKPAGPMGPKQAKYLDVNISSMICRSWMMYEEGDEVEVELDWGVKHRSGRHTIFCSFFPADIWQHWKCGLFAIGPNGRVRDLTKLK